MIAARRPRKATAPDTDAEHIAELEQRVAELETLCGALARTAIFSNLVPDVHQIPNGRIDNRKDAAVIRTASRKRQD